MKAKKILLVVMMLVVLSGMFLSGCEFNNSGLMKNYEGTYTYSRAIDKKTDTSFDYQSNGKLKLFIRDGAVVFNNTTATNELGYVFSMNCLIEGTSLKFIGDGYYYDKTGTTKVERADYAFGTADFVDGELVVNLMFIKNSSLVCDLKIYFTK